MTLKLILFLLWYFLNLVTVQSSRWGMCLWYLCLSVGKLHSRMKEHLVQKQEFALHTFD